MGQKDYQNHEWKGLILAIGEWLVGARGFEPPGSTPRIVLPEWIKLALRRAA
jgi:hypothetical protein